MMNLADETHSAERLREELLIVRCRMGEASAFGELVGLWSARLLRHVHRIAGPELAPDVAQEVWIRALRGICRLREDAKLGAWLFGIAHNVVMDRLRGRYSEQAAITEAAHLTDLPAAECPEALIRHMEESLTTLPPIEREALTLFYLEDMTLLEVSEVQRVPVGTIKSRLFRARRMLRVTMEKDASHES